MHAASRLAFSVGVGLVIAVARSGTAAITIIDYYRLGDADAGAANGAIVNATSQDSVGTKHLTRIGSPTYTSDVFSGATLGAGSLLAVSFSGSGQGLSNAVVSIATDNFGIEAWVRTKSPVGNHSIVYNGNTALSGWGLYQFGGTYGALLGGVSIFGSIPAAVNDWAHLALVRASGVTTLYLNGTPAATDLSGPNVPAGGFCIGLPGQGGGTENFNGDIDEVRVFTFNAGQFSTNDLLVNAPAGVSIATMNDTLQTDVNGNGQVNPGDTVRYTVVITNNTVGTLSNVVFNSGAVPNAPEVAASLRATPLARADAPATNSFPGSPFHGSLNADLFTGVGALFANDFLGVPAAQVASFGGGSFPGTATTTAAGASANAPGIGTLTVFPNGSVLFTPAANFNGLLTFQYRLTNSVGASVATATLAVGFRPSAANDVLVVSGNTFLDSSLIPLNLLGNDMGDLVGVSSIANLTFGSFSFTANGAFTFTPDVGETGAANVNYTITNGFGSSTAQIIMNVPAPPIWYIDGASVAGTADGRSHTPFKTIAQFNAVNDGAAKHPNDNQAILIRDGTYTDSIILRNGQRLIGDGSSGGVTNALGQTLAAGSAIAPGVPLPAFSGTDPVIQSAAGNGVILNANNTIRGLTVGNTPAGFGFVGGTAGNLNITECSKTGSGGAISINTSANLGTSSFDRLESTSSTGANLNLVGVTGTLNVGIAGSGFSGSAVGFAAVNISGGALTLAYPGPVTKANAGRLFDLQRRTGGTLSFSGNLSASGGSTGILCNNNSGGTINFTGGTKTLNTGASTAVSLTSNSGATINFTGGGLGITTTTVTGFNATGGGTVSVQGSGNIINSGNGTALNVVNTTIGASGLTFQSTSSSGGSANGIILDGTGGLAGLTVTGTGSAGSGGTIANKTGADGSTSQGSGAFLRNTRDISLSYMQMNDFQNLGIKGNGVTNFHFRNSVINATGAANNGTTQGEGGIGEGCIRFDNLLGAATILNSTMVQGVYDNVGIFNTLGTLDRLTVSNCTLGTSPNLNVGNDALRFEGSGAGTVMNITALNNNFLGARGNMMDTIAQIGVTQDVVFQKNTCNNTFTNIVSGGGGIIFHGGGTVTFNVQSNVVSGARGRALNVSKAANAGVFSGTISSNTVGNLAVAKSGSTESSCIFVDGGGAGSMAVSVKNNLCYQYNEAGLFFVANNQTIAGNNGSFQATIQGNTTVAYSGAGTFAFAGIWADMGTGVSGDATLACLDIGGAGALGNDFSLGDPFGLDINISDLTTASIRLPGYGGAAEDMTAVASYLKARNLNSATTGWSASSDSGNNGFVGGAACATP